GGWSGLWRGLGLGGGVLLQPLLRHGEHRRRLLVAQAGYSLEGGQPRVDDASRREEAVLYESVDQLRPQAGKGREGFPSVRQLLLGEPSLLLELSLAPDVHVQSRQLGGEARVLAALADGKGELVVRHDHEHRARLSAL